MEKFTSISKKGINLKSKKGQAWSFDLVMAGFIFLVGIIVLYVYAINYSSQSQQHLSELFYEGRIASELILSEEDFGILTNDKINQSKLEGYAGTNYDSKKNTLGLSHDFYFNMSGLELSGAPASYVGKMNTTETEDLIQITRITIYKNKPTKFELFIYN
jgi:hypothetical protein